MAPAHFLMTYADALSRDVCEPIVERFENDARQRPSRTATTDTPKVRTGTQLEIPKFPEWRDVVELVDATIRRHLPDYVEKFPGVRHLAHPDSFTITKALIERIEPGQGYGYHIDAGPPGTEDRFLSTIIYLRDVAEGGFTEFPFQERQIPPQAGTLVMFPPFWTHIHRGVPPISNTKYNITNFLVIRRPPARPPT